MAKFEALTQEELAHEVEETQPTIHTLDDTVANITSRVIVTLSGGKASAWCANWALNTFPKDRVILYFNDTKWEHPDLYRFLDDLEKYFDHPITRDSDGRTPEDIAYSRNFLPNNRVPLCSQILKAERLQSFYQDGDILVFGIAADEAHRAVRIRQMYYDIDRKTNRQSIPIFPLIAHNTTHEQMEQFIIDAGIEIPLLYRLGFKHNNCSGGCVRAGKGHWKHLLEVLPEVYAQREEMEENFRDFSGKDVHFFKDETLKHFRERVQAKKLVEVDDNEVNEVECIGICTTMA